MDLPMIRGKVVPLIKKYRYVILVLVIGILLMSIPEKRSEEQAQPYDQATQPHVDQTSQLSNILTQIKGVGKVEVLLTLETGQKTIFQTDLDDQGQRTDTVIITNEQRAQQGLIQQHIFPEYRGAVVVCQGADDPSVRLAVVQAVANATGLDSDRISVLLMK